MANTTLPSFDDSTRPPVVFSRMQSLSRRSGIAAAAGGVFRERKATITIATKMTTKIAIANRARFCQDMKNC